MYCPPTLVRAERQREYFDYYMLAMILGSGFDVTEYVLQTRLIFVRRAICGVPKSYIILKNLRYPLRICVNLSSFNKLLTIDLARKWFMQDGDQHFKDETWTGPQ
ncbi:hypothetical protein CEXT_669841 [Caerostris extrusa]|uniref:Uncharacterized protein n=1 Tax=Caerostris extrusa TaxID=172846 RepID=A0AAV4PGT8_CAEEX|nr:hypothetical protein CEXT_669841 [Caerostris extrusa]